MILAGVLATIVSGVFGFAQDAVLWRPLRHRGTGLIAMMIVSIGLSIFLRNVYLYVAGADNHKYTQFATVEPWHIGWIDITSKDVLVTLVAVATLLVATQALQRTKTGKADAGGRRQPRARGVVRHQRRPGHRGRVERAARPSPASRASCWG